MQEKGEERAAYNRLLPPNLVRDVRVENRTGERPRRHSSGDTALQVGIGVPELFEVVRVGELREGEEEGQYKEGRWEGRESGRTWPDMEDMSQPNMTPGEQAKTRREERQAEKGKEQVAVSTRLFARKAQGGAHLQSSGASLFESIIVRDEENGHVRAKVSDGSKARKREKEERDVRVVREARDERPLWCRHPV